MNKRGYARILIFGIPLAVIIGFGFELFATGAVINAVAPTIEDTLLQLNDETICPPDLTKESYQICIDNKGGVIVNGNINKLITLQIDSSVNICSIPIGNYDNNQLCAITDLWKAKELYITGIGLFNKKTLQVNELLSYIKTGKYIKAIRVLKYLPVK